MKQKLIILLILSITLVGNAVALTGNTVADIPSISSDIQFNGVTDTIESTVPIFGALQDLIVAVFPYLVVVTFATGMMLLFKLLASDLNLK